MKKKLEVCNIVSLPLSFSLFESNQHDGHERKASALYEGELHPRGAAAEELEVVLFFFSFFFSRRSERFFFFVVSFSSIFPFLPLFRSRASPPRRRLGPWPSPGRPGRAPLGPRGCRRRAVSIFFSKGKELTISKG